MKKLFMFLLVLTMSIALATTVAAGNGPHNSPGEGVIRFTHEDIGDVELVARGTGSSLAIYVYVDGYGVGALRDTENNAYNDFEIEGFDGVLSINIRGNSMINVRVVPAEQPNRFYRFVDYVDAEDSIFVGTTEIANTREFVNSSAVASGWVRGNQNNALFAAFRGEFTGQAVLTGARVTGTLTYQYNRNYIAQSYHEYEWVYVTYLDGERIETPCPDSRFLGVDYYGEYIIVPGLPYIDGPHNGTFAVDETTRAVLLHMGHGQSAVHGRNVTIYSGAFTVNFRLLNTGNNVNNTVITITGVNAGAIDTSPAPVAE